MKTLNISFIGDCYTGKSSCVYYLINKSFQSDSQKTLGVDYHSITEFENKWKIWDISGDRKFSEITRDYYKNKDIFVLFFDINNITSFINLEYWINQIRTYSNNTKKKIILVGNKSDLDKMVNDLEINTFCNKYNLEYIEISIKNNINTKLLFTTINSLTKEFIKQPVFNNNDNYMLLSDEDQKWHCCKGNCLIL